MRVFVWKGIRKNTPLSSKIHCYVNNPNGLHFNRYRNGCKSARFLRATVCKYRLKSTFCGTSSKFDSAHFPLMSNETLCSYFFCITSSFVKNQENSFCPLWVSNSTSSKAKFFRTFIVSSVKLQGVSSFWSPRIVFLLFLFYIMIDL